MITARRTLLAGIGLSLLLHLAVLSTPGWQVPEEERVMPLKARMLALPTESTSPQPAAAVTPKPKPPAKPVVERPGAAEAALPVEPQADSQPLQSAPLAASAPIVADATASAPAAASSPVASTSAPVAASDAIAMRRASLVLPEAVKVSFRAFASKGAMSTEGWGEQRWKLSGDSYSAGMSAGIPFYSMNWSATGKMQAGAPFVTEMRDVRTRKAEAVATVDVPGGKVLQVRGNERRELQRAGVIVDFASLPMFFAAVGEQINAVEMTVIGGYSIETVVVVQDPPKNVTLPIGDHPARRFHAEAGGGRLKIDIWISTQWPGIPVRIKIDQKDDFVIDMQAESVQINGETIISVPRPLPGNE